MKDDPEIAIIVYAVNCHNDLVSALEDLYAKDSHSDLSDQDLHEEAAAGSERAAATLKARAALAKAKATP